MGRIRRTSPLWRIHSPSSIESYLFGTIHISNQSTELWMEKAIYALSKVESCYCETDLDDMKKSSLDVGAPGFDLKSTLGERKYEKFRALAKRHFQIDIESYRFIHPFWLNSRLVLSVVSSPSASSMDHSIWDYAKALDLKTGGIESFSCQKEIFSQISITDQVKELKRTLSNVSKFRAKAMKIVEIYGKGEIMKLYKLSIKAMGASKNMMIYDRNVRMSRIINEICRTESAFVAIGCGHLPGEKGVLRSLKHQGFKLSPIF